MDFFPVGRKEETGIKLLISLKWEGVWRKRGESSEFRTPCSDFLKEEALSSPEIEVACQGQEPCCSA